VQSSQLPMSVLLLALRS